MLHITQNYTESEIRSSAWPWHEQINKYVLDASCPLPDKS